MRSNNPTHNSVNANNANNANASNNVHANQALLQQTSAIQASLLLQQQQQLQTRAAYPLLYGGIMPNIAVPNPAITPINNIQSMGQYYANMAAINPYIMQPTAQPIAPIINMAPTVPNPAITAAAITALSAAQPPAQLSAAHVNGNVLSDSLLPS